MRRNELLGTKVIPELEKHGHRLDYRALFGACAKEASMDLISRLRYAAKKAKEEEAAAATAGVVAPSVIPAHGDAFSLADRVAVVTGSGGGIGRQAAITFARAGARVVLADLKAEGLEETAAMVRSVGGSAIVRTTDVSKRDEVELLAVAATTEFGRLDVWANVAGIIKYFSMVDAVEADVRAILDVNLIGTYWGVVAAAKAMGDQGGSIVNIASAVGELPAPTLSAYGMAKAGVIHLTKTAAAELGAQGIRVNAVAPGFVESPMTAPEFTDANGNVDEGTRASIRASRAGRSPLGRTGEPGDIAYAMLYLACDASRFMTGQTIRPNGGVFMA